MNLCYFGLAICNGFDATKEVGLFLPWFELLGISAIIFAVAEFAETSKTRLLLFHLSFLKSWVLATVAFSIVLTTFANVLPLIPGQAIPILGYPATYEVISLFGISFLFIGFCLFLLRPYWFKPKFSYSLLSNLAGELRKRNDRESLSALIKLSNFYLEKVIIEAKKYDHYAINSSEVNSTQPNKLVLLSRDFIDVIFSRKKICSIIAREHNYFINNFIQLSVKHRLWDSRTGNIFFGNLMESLLTEEDSLLARELNFGGVEGIYNPLSKLIFTTPGILTHYNPISFFTLRDNPLSVKLVVKGLKIALRFYLTTPETSIIHSDSPKRFLHGEIEDLGEASQSYCGELSDFEDNEIYKQKSPQLSSISGFLHDVEHILVVNKKKKYFPQFSDNELKLEKGSVTSGIANAIFEHLQAFCWLKNEKWARQTVMFGIYWVLFSSSTSTPVVRAIRERVLVLIKERVEENFKGNYVSMIKMLTNLYGFNLKGKSSGIIENYFRKIFKKRVAKKLIKDKTFREQHLLSDWVVKRGKIYNSVGSVVYALPKTRTKMRDGSKNGY